MSKLVMMIGLPGSGKSTIAKEMVSQLNNAEILSSDEFRKKLYNDVMKELRPEHLSNTDFSVMDEDDLNFPVDEDAFGNKIEVEEVDEPEPVKINPSRSLSENFKQRDPFEDAKNDVKPEATKW